MNNLIIKSKKWVLDLPRLAKILIVLCVDICACVLAVWVAYFLRLGEFVILSDTPILSVTVSVSIAIPIFLVSGLYREVFRHSGWPALVSVVRATSVYGILYASIFSAYGIADIPRTIGIIQPIMLLLFIAISRTIARFWLSDQYQSLLKKSVNSKVLIYGAGASGRQLADALANNNEMQVAGFLDDDELLHGHSLNGLLIFKPDELPTLVRNLSIGAVLLAMPRLNRGRRNAILNKMRKFQVSVRTLPSLSDLAKGKVSVSDIHELDINDLLGRERVAPNQVLLSRPITKNTIMVTGAGGSIGGELCRQIFELEPEKLILLEQSEFALYNIQNQLENKQSNVTIIPLLGSVQDEDRLRQIMSTWRPHTVYHAAAYKHVPLVEYNLAEGIKNNVIGTLKTARIALEQKIENFVFVSTDKAVRPTNIMGASKRLSEMVLQALAAEKPKTKFSMVRFGNVLDSSGSVVPKFRQQISNGGPITITHKNITRFFMTIPEAAQLVIQAGAMAKGGDVFVLDMGEPVKILELAKKMVELSGFSVRDENNPDGDIPIEITGLRPGEKLYEELLIEKNPEATLHNSIMKAHEDFIGWKKLEVELGELLLALSENDIDLASKILSKLVPEYNPRGGIVDWVHQTRIKNVN